jgi:hypothetical protein
MFFLSRGAWTSMFDVFDFSNESCHCHSSFMFGDSFIIFLQWIGEGHDVAYTMNGDDTWFVFQTCVNSLKIIGWFDWW